ncbi:hypothetical protein CYY_009402 [Polysphondylium violaceum]|uniref:Ankyrin repeat-containing protein n=1 Tax=Polysphondylium violaceum TaxID=133409 RepID=A0A8J4PLW0_9MYCE|nr:hypothetical protein CYY_009402 [Polysphondylium violaceum]
MDQLFHHVFFNQPFIRKHIFYQAAHGANTKTINYRDYSCLNAIIKNGDTKLLELKLHHKEYLMLDMRSLHDLFKLKQLDLFVACMERFRAYLAAPQSHLVMMAAEQNNWEVVQYLIGKGYMYNGQTLLGLACSNGNYALVQDLCKRETEVSLNCFIFSILSKNEEMVKLVFEHGKKSFAKESMFDRERILVDALAIGNLAIFKIVKKYFEESIPLFGIRKWFVYNQALVWRLYVVSVINFEAYKFIYDTFDLSFTRTQDTPSDIQYPPVAATEFGSKEVLVHMFENNLIMSKCTDRMAAKALPYGHFHLYELFSSKYKLNVPLGEFRISNIKGPFPSVEQVRYIVQELDIPLYKNDLLFASKNAEMFKYIFEKGRFQPTMEQLYYCCKHNNLELVAYLHQQGLIVEWTVIANHIFIINPNGCYPLVHLLFTLYQPTLDDLDILVKTMQDAAKLCLNHSVFQLVFYQVFRLTQCMQVYHKSILNACKRGRTMNLQLILEAHMQPLCGELLNEALEKAALGGHLS